MRLFSVGDLKTAKGIPYSRPHIWKLVKAGKFPRPVAIGENRRAWIEAEIDAWIEARAAERDNIKGAA